MAVSDRIAVMNQGRVVQEGTAQDLYHRPANEFVATFVGRVNLVPGRVEDVAEGVASVSALGTTLRVRSPSPGFARGDAVRVVIRPEAIALVGVAAGAPAATVVSHAFLGEKIEYDVRCGDASLHAVRTNAGSGELLRDGAPVALRFAEEALALLPGDAR